MRDKKYRHMAKQMSNSKRTKERLNKAKKVKFEEAIAEQLTSRRDICEFMGLGSWQLTEFFEENPKCYKTYTSRRRELVDTAADNIQDIIEDKTHPQHYAASKYVLQSYKSDLDNILDKQDGEATVEIKGGETSSGVIIKFGSASSKKEEEDGKDSE